MTEIETIRRVRDGDTEAFGDLIDLHVRRLRTHIALRAPVPQIIDEITHETFIYAYRNLAGFKGGSFGAWLNAIADNLLRAEVQRFSRERANRARYAECCLMGEAASNLEASNGGAELEHLQHCLKRLPSFLQRLLALRYENDCSAAEVAGRLGRGISWVRTTLFRVRQQLRECVEARICAEKSG